MPERRVLFYISGHGYGHARRCVQVIESLRRLSPDLAIRVRTSAAARIFRSVLLPESVEYCDVDAGAAEHSTQEIDTRGTLDRMAATIARRDDVVRVEVERLKSWKPTLIVADIPFLAGDVAEAVGVPCFGMSNFTWDWIAEPYVAEHPAYQPVLEQISRSYQKMAGILRLPIGGISAAFDNVIDVPLVANRARRDSAEVLKKLGIEKSDNRPRVLFGIRGAIPTQTLAVVAQSAKDFLLICPTNEPGEVPQGVIPASIGDGENSLDFSDVLSACDVVVGKMGYGLVAECIVSGVAQLWPRRIGFREDEVTEREGPAVMRMRELPMNDFMTGNWAGHIRKAASLPPPPTAMRADGADVCARWIVDAAHTS